MTVQWICRQNFRDDADNRATRVKPRQTNSELLVTGHTGLPTTLGDRDPQVVERSMRVRSAMPVLQRGHAEASNRSSQGAKLA